jgi:hypothetical protein
MFVFVRPKQFPHHFVIKHYQPKLFAYGERPSFTLIEENMSNSNPQITYTWASYLYELSDFKLSKPVHIAFLFSEYFTLPPFAASVLEYRFK